MRKIDMGELREKQMQILDYVAQFCDEHGIRYIIEGGTMLGAIRHGGYIPWDDDIDVGMLREDYQRFIELFSQEAKDGYVFACSETTEGWHLPFGKVMDTNTLLVQDGHNLGINIDIFPYDDAPEDPQVMKKMYDTRDRLKVLNAIQCSKENPLAIRSSGWRYMEFVLRCTASRSITLSAELKSLPSASTERVTRIWVCLPVNPESPLAKKNGFRKEQWCPLKTGNIRFL